MKCKQTVLAKVWTLFSNSILLTPKSCVSPTSRRDSGKLSGYYSVYEFDEQKEKTYIEGKNKIKNSFDSFKKQFFFSFKAIIFNSYYKNDNREINYLEGKRSVLLRLAKINSTLTLSFFYNFIISPKLHE